MTDLSSLTLQTFSGLLGEAFVVAGADPQPALILEEAEPVGGGGERQAFSLVFVGPVDAAFDQGMRALEHAQLGRLEIFLVPIAAGQYQAIFA